MTTIDFYTHCADRYDVAARLVTKAWAQHGSVRVLTPDEATTVRFDRFLWQSPATGFVPHCRLDDAVAGETPVLVDHALEHQGPAVVLINLHGSPPPFFSRFERLAEVIGTGDEEAAAGRERWKFYKARGYDVRPHNLAERA
jgi:DNA polymerase III subunit chi